MTVTIALDAMGGDHGARVVVPAAVRALTATPDLSLALVGHEDVLRPLLEQQRLEGGRAERIRIVHAPQRVEMDDLPSQALRTKRESSMRIALELLKSGEAHACVSAGNTGALMATARFVLKTLPGIHRPAILSALPAITGHTNVLDLGANVAPTPRQLFEFAVMGSVLTSAIEAIARPRVGLLNIGQEEIKGNETVKEAARLLAASDLHYIGFVEGDDIYRGTADVVVCDGFSGNVALKSSEGVAQLIAHQIRSEFDRTFTNRLIGLLARPILRSVGRRIDPRTYNGASLVGLRGIVVKSHGSADEISFANAIHKAVAEHRRNVPERINEHLEAMLAHKEAV